MTNLLKKIIGNDNKHLTYQLEQHLGKVSVAPARAKAETANSHAASNATADEPPQSRTPSEMTAISMPSEIRRIPTKLAI